MYSLRQVLSSLRRSPGFVAIVVFIHDGVALCTYGYWGDVAGPSATMRISVMRVSDDEPRVSLEIKQIVVVALVGAELILVVVSLVACLVPGWRATRADPMTILRAT